MDIGNTGQHQRILLHPRSEETATTPRAEHDRRCHRLVRHRNRAGIELERASARELRKRVPGARA